LLSTIINKLQNRILKRRDTKNKNHSLGSLDTYDKTKVLKIKKALKLYRDRIQKVFRPFLIISLSLLVPLTQIDQQVFAYHQQYRLSLPSELEHQPSYSIRIPFGVGQTDYSLAYDPSQIAIPAGMTVVWFNDDSNPHTVTTI
jgi:hypothetical protein